MSSESHAPPPVVPSWARVGRVGPLERSPHLGCACVTVLPYMLISHHDHRSIVGGRLTAIDTAKTRPIDTPCPSHVKKLTELLR